MGRSCNSVDVCILKKKKDFWFHGGGIPNGVSASLLSEKHWEWRRSLREFCTYSSTDFTKSAMCQALFHIILGYVPWKQAVWQQLACRSFSGEHSQKHSVGGLGRKDGTGGSEPWCSHFMGLSQSHGELCNENGPLESFQVGVRGWVFVPPNLQVADVGYLCGGIVTLEEALPLVEDYSWRRADLWASTPNRLATENLSLELEIWAADHVIYCIDLREATMIKRGKILASWRLYSNEERQIINKQDEHENFYYSDHLWVVKFISDSSFSFILAYVHFPSIQ